MPSQNAHEPIYLDNNATTPILPEVADAVRTAALRFPANPASQHRSGQAARRVLEEARECIARLLGAKTTGMDADRLVFVSGGTESNNLAIRGLLASRTPGHCITSAMEHPSVLGPFEELGAPGLAGDPCQGHGDGIVRLDEMEAALRDDTHLVSIMAANNETGVLQPLGEIGKLCADRGVPLHTDAAQGVGKLPTQFRDWQLAALSCAAHKFNGPMGIGALLVSHDAAIAPQLFGGHQQQAMRPGTESVALAVGMRVALEAWQREAASWAPRTGGPPR